MPCASHLVEEANRLNRIIKNPRESKNSRNAAITMLGKLSRAAGVDLRWA